MDRSEKSRRNARWEIDRRETLALRQTRHGTRVESVAAARNDRVTYSRRVALIRTRRRRRRPRRCSVFRILVFFSDDGGGGSLSTDGVFFSSIRGFFVFANDSGRQHHPRPRCGASSPPSVAPFEHAPARAHATSRARAFRRDDVFFKTLRVPERVRARTAASPVSSIVSRTGPANRSRRVVVRSAFRF